MTQHHIIGSEAFAPRAHVLVRVGRRRRRPLHPALKAHALALAVGLAAGFADVAFDAPIALPLVLAALFAWRIWPAAR